MKKTHQSVDIDESLYSRQLYVLGHEFMKRLAVSHVLISGLDGLGVEIAKNVILGGVRQLVLHDKQTTTFADLASQFYLNEGDIGKNRAAACHARLEELNSYVKVEHSSADLIPEFLDKFQAVVLCDYVHFDEISTVGDYCHKAGIKLIVASTRGLFGQLFCDFGDEFLVADPDGEDPVSSVIEDITYDKENGMVKLTENNSPGFSKGDLVVFSHVRGAVELNSMGPIEVKSTVSPFVFSIGDTTRFGKYTGGGVATEAKQQVIVKFKSFRQAVSEPEFVISDFAKMDRQSQLHLAFANLGEFVKATCDGKLPAPRCSETARKFVDFCKSQKGGEELDEKLIYEFVSQVAGDVCPMNAVIGGVAAQEVIKAVTRKFTPLQQWLYFDALECLPVDRSMLTAENCKPTNSRYDAQAAVFGRQFIEKLMSQQLFLVGTGAIGCEMLKNWAMMGIGCGKNGHVTVTDMDLIERSNLNRQFLFRADDLNQPKSERAAAAVRRTMNSAMNITAHKNRVGLDTEEIYGDDFFAKLNIVVNALDNIEARKYMDQRCVYYKKPLLESGTLGTKANIQVVLPDLTESYSSSQDPPEKSFPMCTIKNFPTAIEHTLAWAKEMFDNFFEKSMVHVERYIEDPDFISNTLQHNATQAMEILTALKRLLVDDRPKDFQDCVNWARIAWENNFHNEIEQMLFNFPPDAKTTEGQRFWSGSKRCPHSQKFNAENELHLAFIMAAANLRAEMFGIKQIRDESEIKAMISRVNVPKFTPKSGVRIAVTDQEMESHGNMDGEDVDDVERHMKELVAALPSRESLKDSHFQALDFEKDDDSNFHMDFIVAASNTRATIYDIPTADRHKSKGIAGRIIPAIATTTSVAVGLVCLELLKTVQGHDDLELYKNGFLNLAFPFFAFSTPIQPKVDSYNGKKWTLWDRFVITGEPTIGELIDKMKKDEGLEVSMMSAGVLLLFTDFMPPAKAEQRKKMRPSDVVAELQKQPIPSWQRAIVLEICCCDTEGNDVDVPFVQYVLK